MKEPMACDTISPASSSSKVCPNRLVGTIREEPPHTLVTAAVKVSRRPRRSF